jgi:S-adenosylhomocysteine hydrolase
LPSKACLAPEAAPQGDIFVTATGCMDVIRGEHMSVMKDSAFGSPTKRRV